MLSSLPLFLEHLFELPYAKIPPQVLQAAWACSRESYLWGWCGECASGCIRNFVAGFDYLYRGLPPPRPLQKKLINFHKIVERFTEDYCSTILEYHPITRKPEVNYKSPSQTEIIRIQRGLYLYQLFCDFQQQCKSRETDWQYSACSLADKLNSWEAEELDCIYNFLEPTHLESLLRLRRHREHSERLPVNLSFASLLPRPNGSLTMTGLRPSTPPTIDPAPRRRQGALHGPRTPFSPSLAGSNRG
jgi:hypothetical protein